MIHYHNTQYATGRVVNTVTNHVSPAVNSVKWRGWWGLAGRPPAVRCGAGRPPCRGRDPRTSMGTKPDTQQFDRSGCGLVLSVDNFDAVYTKSYSYSYSGACDMLGKRLWKVEKYL